MEAGITVMKNASTLDKLLACLCRRGDILAVYRFGSWGTDAQRPDSDIDLAILATAPLDPVELWELAQKLAVPAGRDVDLVDLLQAGTVMRMQVISGGTRLFQSDFRAVEEFEDRVFSAYVRFNEERKDILNQVRERGAVYDK